MIFAKNFARNCEKKISLGTSNAWSLVGSFVQTNQRPSVIYYGLTDFRTIEKIITF